MAPAPTRNWYSNRSPTQDTGRSASGDTSPRYQRAQSVNVVISTASSPALSATSQAGNAAGLLELGARRFTVDHGPAAEQPDQPHPLRVESRLCAAGMGERFEDEPGVVEQRLSISGRAGQSGVVESREQRRPRLGPGPQTRAKPVSTRQFRLDQRLEQVVRTEPLAVGQIPSPPAVDRHGVGHDPHGQRRAGVLALELAQLPLPAQQPERVVDPRLDPGPRIAGRALRLQSGPGRRIAERRDVELDERLGVDDPGHGYCCTFR